VGVVDSSFFWGYIVTQIPGGFLAARYPANRVFGSAIATSAGLNMLLPIAAKAGFQYVMLVRIFQGLVEVSARSSTTLFLFLSSLPKHGPKQRPFPICLHAPLATVARRQTASTQRHSARTPHSQPGQALPTSGAHFNRTAAGQLGGSESRAELVSNYLHRQLYELHVCVWNCLSGSSVHKLIKLHGREPTFRPSAQIYQTSASGTDLTIHC